MRNLGAQLPLARTQPKHCDRLLPQQERSLYKGRTCLKNAIAVLMGGVKAFTLEKSFNKSQRSIYFAIETSSIGWSAFLIVAARATSYIASQNRYD
jgi:hypothetical protein